MVSFWRMPQHQLSGASRSNRSRNVTIITPDFLTARAPTLFPALAERAGDSALNFLTAEAPLAEDFGSTPPPFFVSVHYAWLTDAFCVSVHYALVSSSLRMNRRRKRRKRFPASRHSRGRLRSRGRLYREARREHGIGYHKVNTQAIEFTVGHSNARWKTGEAVENVVEI